MKHKIWPLTLGAAFAALFGCLCVGFFTHPASKSRYPTTNPEYLRKRREREQRSNDALRAYRNGDFGRAEQLYRQAVQANPDDTLGWDSLAKLYDEQKRDRDALDAYDHMLHHSKRVFSSMDTDPEALYRYAHLCEQFGRHQDAMQSYRNILLAAAQSEPAHSGDLQIKTDVQDPTEARARACLFAGREYSSHGREDVAMQCYQEALRLKPGLAAAHFVLARHYEAGSDGRDWKNCRAKAKAEFIEAQRLGGEEVQAAFQRRIDRARKFLQDRDARYGSHMMQEFTVDKFGETHRLPERETAAASSSVKPKVAIKKTPDGRWVFVR